ncbi:MAG TPA: thiol-activated cytolysin family protein, partial [Pricia sp.]|nr:thiol-activated cytolysin family protein [Pricia sp.]
AIGELINEAERSGVETGSNINYNNFTTYSLEQASLKMGLSASYMGASVASSLSANISNEKRTVTAYFTQQMFTASMVLPQYPEDVFSEDFTEELLQREQESGRMSPDNPPVYVSSIVYGRILMFSFTSTSTEVKIKATLNAMYNAGEFGGELDSELQTVLDEAEINVVTVGGDADQAIDLIRENNLAAFFTTDAPLTTAKPISYTVRNLKDNAVARVSETTSYDLRECNPIEPTGAEYTFQLTRLEIVALPDIDNSDLITQQGEFYWQLYFEDLAGPQEAAYTPYDLIPPHGQPRGFDRLGGGEFANLVHFESSGLLASSTEPVKFDSVPLHRDGRDYIRFHGSVWDHDEYNADEEFPIYREFKGEEGHLALSQDDEKRQFKIRSADEFGNIIEIFGTYQRTKILYD